MPKEPVPDWLLRRAGYTEADIKIYRDLWAMPLRVLNSEKLAEAYLLLRGTQDETKKLEAKP